jgi:hypothetical protein
MTDKKPGIFAGFFSHLFFLLFAFDALAMRSNSFRSSAVSSSLSLGLGGRLGKGITSGTHWSSHTTHYKTAPSFLLTSNCCISAAIVFRWLGICHNSFKLGLAQAEQAV